MTDPRLQRRGKTPLEIQREKEFAELKKAFKTVAGTAAGKRVLQHFMTELGWKAPMLAINPKTQEIVKDSTVYNVSKRDVWLQVRHLIPWNLLNVIEMETDPNAGKQTENDA